MLNKVLSYSIVGVLLVALLGGTVYVLASPDKVAEQQGQGRASIGKETTAQGYAAQGYAAQGYAAQNTGYRGGRQGNGRAQFDDGEHSDEGRGYGSQQSCDGTEGVNGQGQGRAEAGSASQGYGTQGQSGSGRGNSGGQGQDARENSGAGMRNDTELSTWETVQGIVTVADSELTVQTTMGEIIVGLGQAWYREQAGFDVSEGDEVVVKGFYEDGEFKAGTVENLTTGTSIMLRDESGRPMWSGRGNLKNQS